MKEKKSSFADKMRSHITHRKERESNKSYGYLNLPKGLKTLSVEEDIHKIKVDFLLYLVTDKRHPDLVASEGIAAVGTPWWSRPFSIHREVGPAGNDSVTVVCPTSIGKKCPICEHRVKRIKEGADKEEYKHFYPKQRRLYVVNVLEIKKKGMEEFEEFEDAGVPLIWDMSTKLFQDVLDEILEEYPEHLDFCSLETGKTAVLTLKWEKLGKTTYPEVRHIDFEEREPYDEKILEDIPNLDDLLVVRSYEEIENLFYELDNENDTISSDNDPDDDSDADSDDDPKPSLLGRKRKIIKPDTEEKDEEKPLKRSLTRKDSPQSKKRTLKSENEEDDEEPVNHKKGLKSPAKSSATEKCEYGHRFGIDAMEFEECENDCPIWNECLKEKERNEQ